MQKYRDIIDKTAVAQKCAVVTGKMPHEVADMPELRLGKYPGRESDGGFFYLSQSALARTWNYSLIEETAACIGAGAAEAGINVLRAPNIGIKREALAENSNLFSEDPYLTGKSAAAYVRGVQRAGIAACAVGYPIAPNDKFVTVDERALRELYATPAEIAVRGGGAQCVEVSRCKLNGIDVRRSAKFMTGVLRNEWDFGGAVMSEVASERIANGALAAGVDLVIPADQSVSADTLNAAVEKYETLKKRDWAGKNALDEAVRLCEAVSPNTLDNAAEKVLELASVVSGPLNKTGPQQCAAIRARAADESVVLLKNKNKILPLGAGVKIALAGSPEITDAFAASFDGDVTSVIGIAGGFDAAATKGACVLAVKADVTVVFLGADSAENCELPAGQRELLTALKNAGAKIIAVLTCDRIIDSDFDTDCNALLLAGGLGKETANCVLRVLFGKTDPSGKLTESRPSAEWMRHIQLPVSRDGTVGYTDSLYVGYRYYEKAGISVKYPFGHGLSYTSFRFSDLNVSKDGVTFKLANEGQRDGAEVAQLYVGKRASHVARPVKELKGFAKVFLKAGETLTVEIPFDNYTFRYYNVASGKWEIESGDYEIIVGASSADSALSGSVKVNGTNERSPYALSAIPSYASGRVEAVSKKEFDNLLGFDARMNLAAERRIMRKKKVVIAMILAILMLTIDLSLTLSNLVRLYYSDHLFIFLVANLSLIAIFTIIIAAAGTVKPNSRLSEYLSPATKEDNAYMIYPETVRVDSPNRESVTGTPDMVAPDITLAADSQTAVNNSDTRMRPLFAYETVTFPQLCERLSDFAAENGLTVEPAAAQAVLAAMTGSRLIVLKNADAAVSRKFAEIVNAFCGGHGKSTDAKTIADAGDLFSDAAFAGAVRSVPDDGIAVFTINNADPCECGCISGILPFAQTPVRPCIVSTAPGAAVLKDGMWFFVVPDTGMNYKPFTQAVAGCSAVVEVAARIKDETAIAVNARPITFGTWQAAVKTAKETRFVREELWKKLDRLEEYLSGRAAFTVGNKLFRRLENHTSVLMACGADETEALDSALASMLMPVLAAYQETPFKDGENGLAEVLDRIFGADNIAASQKAVKRLGID